METPQLYGQPVPVFDHPHSKKVYVQVEPPVLQFVPLALSVDTTETSLALFSLHHPFRH